MSKRGAAGELIGLLCVASSHVEGQREATEAMADDGAADAHRIPRLFPSSDAFGSPQQQQLRPNADLMLGLKTLAAHADRQPPLLRHDSNPMPSFPSLCLSALPTSAPVGFTRLPSIMAPAERENAPPSLSPLRFGEYLGRKHKRGETRMADDATSPTGCAQMFSHNDRGTTLSPSSSGSSLYASWQWPSASFVSFLLIPYTPPSTCSPYACALSAAPAPRILPVATTIAWRSSNPIFAPSNKRFRPASPLSDSADAFQPEYLDSQQTCVVERVVRVDLASA